MKHLKLFIPLLILSAFGNGCRLKNDAPPETASASQLIRSYLDTALAQKDAEKGLAMLRPLYRQPFDSATHAIVCRAIARWYYENNPIDSAAPYGLEALSYLKHHQEYLRYTAECYNMVGQSYWWGSKPNLSLANNYQSNAALLCMDSTADALPVDVRVVILMQASESNRYAQMYAASLRYGQAAVSLGRQHQDSIPIPYIKALTEYAKVLIENKQFDSAWYYCNTARLYNDAKVHNVLMRRDIDGTLGACFYANNQLDSAGFYTLRKIGYDERNIPLDSNLLFSGYYSMLGIYNQLHRKEEAKIYLDKAQKLLTHGNITDEASLKNFTENKIYYNILYGDRAATQLIFNDYTRQEKDFYNKEQLKMTEAAYAEYDLADKERKIQSLNVQRLKAESSLRARTNLLTMAALASLLAVLAAIILILLQRQSKLKNKQQLLEAEHNKTELEQRLLRTQIEPHFIFNTLTNLLTLIDKGENHKASGYLLRFANLLRTSLDNSKESYVPLSEELDALENYLELQKMRFHDLFEFEIHVAPGLNTEELLLPPMLLQPIVENAVVHGFKGIQYKGLIQIRISRNQTQLNCIVSNNGNGYLPSNDPNRLMSSSTITTERLAILSRQTGQPASVQIITEPGRKGVSVELVVPFKEG